MNTSRRVSLLPLTFTLTLALAGLLSGCTGGSGDSGAGADADLGPSFGDSGFPIVDGGLPMNDSGITLTPDAAMFADASIGGVCNPVTQAGCQSGFKCAQLVHSEEPFLAQTTCVPDGFVTEGGACTRGEAGPNGYDDCVAGYDCLRGLCAEICSGGGGFDTCRTPDQGFGEGGYCTLYADLFSDDIGLCAPACHPSDDSAAGGAVNHDTCPGTQGCYLNVGQEVASCAGVPAAATTTTQNDDCYGPAAGSCYLNGCASGYSPILPNAVGQAATTNTCTRYCTPVETHTNSTAGAAGAEGKCGSSALNTAGSSTAGTHQCRFVQSLYGAPGLPHSVGMCVPSSIWTDCTDLDWDGLSAAVNGASNPQDAFDLFCFGVTNPEDDAPLDPKCQGLGFGCVRSATEQALFDQL